MSEPAFATVSDLEARWRPLTEAERVSAQVLIADASQLIIDERGSTSDVSTGTLKRVVCAIVKRAMAGPGGIGVESLQTMAGPYQESVKYSNPTGDLYLTRAERKALGMVGQRAFEVDLMPPDAGREGGWWT